MLRLVHEFNFGKGLTATLVDGGLTVRLKRPWRRSLQIKIPIHVPRFEYGVDLSLPPYFLAKIGSCIISVYYSAITTNPERMRIEIMKGRMYRTLKVVKDEKSESGFNILE